MKFKSIFKYLFLILISVFSFTMIGNAAFWISTNKSVSGTPTIDENNFVAVCYVGDNKYRSIEEAVNAVGTPSKATTI